MSPYQPARTPALFICMMEIWSFTTMHSNHSLQPSHNNIASRSPQFFSPSFFSDDMECNLRVGVGVVSGRVSCILSGYLVPLCMGSSAALKLSDKHPEHARTASCTGEADHPLVRSKIKVMCRMRCAWHLQDQQGKLLIVRNIVESSRSKGGLHMPCMELEREVSASSSTSSSTS